MSDNLNKHISMIAYQDIATPSDIIVLRSYLPKVYLDQKMNLKSSYRVLLPELLFRWVKLIVR